MKNSVLSRFVICVTIRIQTAVFEVNAKTNSAEKFPAYDDIQFSQLSVDDGLSQVAVMDIAQDIDGFMWFATQGGLDRYDGTSFINYESDEQNKKSIPGSFIAFSQFSRDGNLWIGTNGQGVANKAPDETAFTSIPFYSSNKLLNSIQAKSFLQDSRGDIWVGTWNSGLFKFNTSRLIFEHVWSVEGRQVAITSIAEWQNEIILGTHGAGVWKINELGKPLLSIRSQAINQSKIQDLLVEEETLWIATSKGLWAQDKNAQIRKIDATIGTLQLNQLNLYRLFLDHKNNLWIGTLGQGIIIKDKSGRWTQQKASEQKGSLSNNRIFSLFQDKTGVIWVGSEGGGLNYYDPYSTSFHHIYSNKTSTKFLNDKMIYSIYRLKNGDWWIGTESGGVNHWHADTGRFTYYNMENGNIPHNTVRAMLPWDGNFWIATLNGLALLDLNGNKLTEINIDNAPALGHNAIFALLKADEDHFWIGSYGGLDLFDTRTNTITLSHRLSDTHRPLPRNVVTALLQTKDSLWVGTFGKGIARFSLKEEKVDYYKYDKNQLGSLSNDTVWSIIQSVDDTVWVATDGGGLNRFDQATNQFKKITKKDGLSNNVIYGILQESDSSFWVSSNRGLSRISVTDGDIINFYL
ncbi:MAG: hypothetical protein L3J46_08620, partial [Kangiellaceae bacterium]|nr:hypothetical protein [Kangiellaceae bacterium]